MDFKLWSIYHVVFIFICSIVYCRLIEINFKLRNSRMWGMFLNSPIKSLRKDNEYFKGSRNGNRWRINLWNRRRGWWTDEYPKNSLPKGHWLLLSWSQLWESSCVEERIARRLSILENRIKSSSAVCLWRSRMKNLTWREDSSEFTLLRTHWIVREISGLFSLQCLLSHSTASLLLDYHYCQFRS